MKYVIVSMFALLMWMPEAMRAQVIVKLDISHLLPTRMRTDRRQEEREI